MTTRRNFLENSLLAAGATAIPAFAQKKDKEIPKYRLSYKNTYLKVAAVKNSKQTI